MYTYIYVCMCGFVVVCESRYIEHCVYYCVKTSIIDFSKNKAVMTLAML